MVTKSIGYLIGALSVVLATVAPIQAGPCYQYCDYEHPSGSQVYIPTDEKCCIYDGQNANRVDGPCDSLEPPTIRCDPSETYFGNADIVISTPEDLETGKNWGPSAQVTIYTSQEPCTCHWDEPALLSCQCPVNQQLTRVEEHSQCADCP